MGEGIIAIGNPSFVLKTDPVYVVFQVAARHYFNGSFSELQ
jgi:hypothetical protein